MASIIKVDTIQDQNGNNIINEAANTITIGASGDTITIPSGATLANSGIVTGFQSTGIDDNATSTAITIDSSQQVGIGTSTPGRQFEISSTNTYLSLKSTDTSNGTSQIFFGDTSDDNVGRINYQHGNNAMLFLTSASEAMRIDSSGRVGIGTSSPSTRLDVNGTVKFVDTMSFSDSGATVSCFFQASTDIFQYGTSTSDDIAIYTNNAERMRIDSSGNVGIGTNSPNVKLQVQGASALGSGTGTTNAIRIHDTSVGSSWSTTQDFNQLQFSSGDTSAPGGAGVRYSIGVVSHDAANTYSDLTFRNYDGTEHMRINGAYGSVGIANTNPSYNLEIGESDGVSNRGLSFNLNNNVGQIRTRSNLSDTQTHYEIINSNGTVGTIRTVGSATQFNTSSDYRLKENVNYDFDATTRLKQLKPARFNFIADANTTVDGFLAHEVSSIVPEAISGEKDAVKEDGTPDYQGIDQSKLVPLLVKTIQELEARITALETQP